MFWKRRYFVLDFVNTAEDIQASFYLYYEESIIQETTDANIMYDLKIKLDEYRVYWEREIDELSKAYFKSLQRNKEYGLWYLKQLH